MNNNSKTKIKISIVVPVYNSEQYVAECINSVFRQSIKEIELIMIDDGSTDASCQVIEKYAKKDKRICLIKQNHRGSGPARNLGIEHANGEYVAFLDSDDFYYDNTALEQMYNTAKKNHILICASYRLYVFQNNAYSKRNIFNLEENFSEPRLIDFKNMQNDFYYTQYLFSTSMLKTNKIKFPPYSRYQDPPFLISVLSVYPQVLVCPVSLYCYRWGHKKMNFSEHQVIDILKGMQSVIEIAQEHGWSKLIQKTVERINKGGGFHSVVKNNLTESVKKSIRKINQMVNTGGNNRTIDLYDEIKEEIKVSIIVPVYNVENFLCQCIDSLIAQTLQDIEIICVNDGSTDNSLSIMQKYAEKDRRIKIIDKPNSGYGHTMNIGLHSASGMYIGIVESDDWVELNMFEKLYEAAVQNDYPDLIKSDAYITETEDKSEIVHPWGVKYNEVLNMDKHVDLVVYTPSTTTAIYKRTMFIENDIKWNETPGASLQDTSFAIMMIMFSKRTYVIPQPFYHYRVNRPTSSRNISNKGFCIFDEFNYIESLLAKREEMKRKYWPILQVTKYKRCQWCANRVTDTKAFWRRAAREFSIAQKDGFMIKDLWNKNDWKNVQQLIDDWLQETSKDDENHSGDVDKYIFPYHLVKQGAKIVIYGAGKMGQLMWKMISLDRLVTPIAIFARKGDSVVLTDCLPAEVIKQMVFDFVVISELDKEEAKTAERELLSYGIRPECIKWDGEAYSRSIFIKRYFYSLMKGME